MTKTRPVSIKAKKCVVCGKQALKQLNKLEVVCTECKSQYPLEWLHSQAKGKKNGS
jgi:hypothetical protein